MHGCTAVHKDRLPRLCSAARRRATTTTTWPRRGSCDGASIVHFARIRGEVRLPAPNDGARLRLETDTRVWRKRILIANNICWDPFSSSGVYGCMYQSERMEPALNTHPNDPGGLFTRLCVIRLKRRLLRFCASQVTRPPVQGRLSLEAGRRTCTVLANET